MRCLHCLEPSLPFEAGPARRALVNHDGADHLFRGTAVGPDLFQSPDQHFITPNSSCANPLAGRPVFRSSISRFQDECITGRIFQRDRHAHILKSSMLRRSLTLPHISPVACVMGDYGRLSYKYHAEKTIYAFIGQVQASGNVEMKLL